MMLLSVCDFPWWLMWLLPLLGFLLGSFISGSISGKKINKLTEDLNDCNAESTKWKGEYDGVSSQFSSLTAEHGLLNNRFDEVSLNYTRSKAEKEKALKEADIARKNLSALQEGASTSNKSSKSGKSDSSSKKKAVKKNTELDGSNKEHSNKKKESSNKDSIGKDKGGKDKKTSIKQSLVGNEWSDHKGDLNYDVHAKLKETNLQVIEGIGPKMEELLKRNGVNTWSDLSKYNAKSLRAILDKESPTKYKIIDPTTWAEQATLAAHGRWNVLTDFQKNLDTGKANTLGNTDAKVEKLLIKLGYLRKWKQDDLKAIEGIGPKIEGLFHEAGIKTWKALSESSVDKLKEILTAAGKRYRLADPGTWPEQARMAHEGLWNKLQEYQDFLQGGK